MEILILQRPNRSLKLPLKSFVRQLKRIKSILLTLHPTKKTLIKKTFAILLFVLLVLNKNVKLCTLESLPQKKWIIIVNKQIFSDPNTLAMSWVQTSIKALLFNRRTIEPFWNTQCKEMSSELWLPTLKSSFVNEEEFKNSRQNASWFTIRMLQNPQIELSKRAGSSISTKFPPTETSEEEGIRSRKIRIYPTSQQKQIFRNWIKTTTDVYNRALKALKTEEETKYDFYALRNRFVTYQRRTGERNPEVEESETDTPKDIRAGGLKDLVTGFKAARTNLKKGNIRKFNLG